jgi:hypothetical protein
MPIGRHDDLVDHGLDDGAERGTDDDADRHIDHVAAHGEVAEFLDHAHDRLLFFLMARAVAAHTAAAPRIRGQPQ